MSTDAEEMQHANDTVVMADMVRIGRENEALRREIEEAKRILWSNLDRDREELPLTTLATIASNGLYWRKKEIEELRQEVEEAKGINAAAHDQLAVAYEEQERLRREIVELQADKARLVSPPPCWTS